MKVCYVTHLPNLTGASQSLLDILSGTKDVGIEAVVLLGKHGPIESELKRRKVRYEIIPYSSEIKEKSIIVNAIKRIKNFIFLNKVKTFFKKECFDLIHNNSFLVNIGMEAAWQLKIPYICHLRDFIYEDHHLKLIHENRQYFLMEQSDLALTISEAVKVKFYKRMPTATFYTLPDGIDVKKYFQKHRKILKNESVKMILAGRIAPGKGQLEAIKALQFLVDWGITNVRLTIVGGIGDNIYYKEIKEYVKDKRIKQVQFIDFTDLRQLRSESDIGLVCSSSEALGRVTVESMLSGCLTIGAAAGATVEIIDDGHTGLLYKQGDCADLAKKILYALHHIDEMQTIVEQGQKCAAEKYSSELYNRKLLQIYRTIVTKRQKIANF